jgi:hypothetical protein
MRRNLLAVPSSAPAVNQALGPTTLDLTSKDHQELLLRNECLGAENDRSGDVGHHPRPKHLEFPRDLPPIESEIVDCFAIGEVHSR